MEGDDISFAGSDQRGSRGARGWLMNPSSATEYSEGIF